MYELVTSMTWIPAFAGMTCLYYAVSGSVIPAKAGIQSGFIRTSWVVTQYVQQLVNNQAEDVRPEYS
ncbi:hypothetical protein JCM31598_11220 [Desulfonatronum parangueonense]